MELTAKIADMIQSILEQHQCYLDEIVYEKEGNEWYLRIFVEKINGSLDMETCVAVSEKISDKLDEEDPIKDEYYLEVSSPGAEKPLKSLEQVSVSIGKYVYIKLSQPMAGLDEVQGTILDVVDGVINLEYLVKNIKKRVEIPYDRIKFIRLAVKF
ncbi:MAG: ribosome maturation factor RimP [Erysipelotrichaceae bacterium]|nr:ribosome maturation factor RimP [Erysipelotrichaceae bacterium]